MKFHKLILVIIVILTAFRDFSKGVYYNSWATEPVSDLFIMYENYISYQIWKRDGAIMPDSIINGIDVDILCGIMMFFSVSYILIRALCRRSEGGGLFFILDIFSGLAFLVSFVHQMVKWWNHLEILVWVFLAVVLVLLTDLIFCDTRLSRRKDN